MDQNSETTVTSITRRNDSRCCITITSFIWTTIIFIIGFVLLEWGTYEGDWTGICLGFVLLIFVPFFYAPVLTPYEGWKRAWDTWVYYFRIIFTVVSVLLAITWGILYIFLKDRDDNTFDLNMWYPSLCIGLLFIGFLLALINTLFIGCRYPSVESQEIKPNIPLSSINSYRGDGGSENQQLADEKNITL